MASDSVEITYNGKPIVMPTPELEAWMQYYWKLSHISNSESPYRINENRLYSRWDSRNRQIAPGMLNWPGRPSLGLNQLYIPNGASQWGECWIFGREAITSGDLLVQATIDNTTTIGTFPLQTIRVWQVEGDLYLHHLVDIRYDIQAATVFISETDAQTWDSLFEAISNRLSDFGIGFVYDTANAAYLDPSQEAIANKEHNLGQLIDAAASSIGQIPLFSHQLVPAIKLGKPGAVANSSQSAMKIVSATPDADTPSIRFLFSSCPIGQDTSTFPVSITGTGTAEFSIQSAAQYTGSNGSVLTALATQWASDWYENITDQQTDAKYAGWLSEDRWNAGKILTIQGSEFSTRLISLPPNFSPVTQLSQETACTYNNGSRIVKVPVGGLPARSGITVYPVTCDVYEVDLSDQLIATGESIDVYSPGDSIAAGKYVTALLLQDGTYAAELGTGTGTGVTFRYGTALTTLEPGGSCTVDEAEWSGSAWVSLAGSPVTVFDSAVQACYLPGEIVVFHDSTVTGQAETAVSFGLERWAKAPYDIIPDKTNVTQSPYWSENVYDLVTFDADGSTSPSLGGPGTFTKLTPTVGVSVMDPLQLSTVWVNQVVKIVWSPEFGTWVLAEQYGAVQRGRVASVPTNLYHTGPGAAGSIVVNVYNPTTSTAGNSMADWGSSGTLTQVAVKREYCRHLPRAGDEVELRREPVVRGYVNGGQPSQFAVSAWVISDVNTRVVQFNVTESAQSQGALNRRYDIRYPDGTLFYANWGPRAGLDQYKRLTNVEYGVGTTLTALVSYANGLYGNQAGVAAQVFTVLTIDEIPSPLNGCT